MNTDLIPPSLDPSPGNRPPVRPPPARKSKRRYIPHLVSWLVGLFVLLVLAVMVLPSFGGCGSPNNQVRAMAHSKQIVLALKLFASDNDGVYPCAGLPGTAPTATVTNSNQAFAMLFPTYLTSETLFGNPLSAYQTRQPDNVIDSPYTGRPVRTLEPGENVYSYVAGLTEASDPAAPLVVDGTDGTGHYTTDAKKRGGVWKGKTAMVVHLDSSATIETLAGPDHARYVPVDRARRSPDTNLLDVVRLGLNVRLLDPAVGR